MNRSLATIACLLVPASLGGCATSKESRELATETAVAVQSLQLALAENAKANQARAAEASRRLSLLLRSTAGHQSDLEARVDASGRKADYEALRNFIDSREAARVARLQAADASAKAVADSQQAWQAPIAALREVTGNLTTLGREETLKERLKASAQFLKEVRDRVKDAEKAADEAKAPAPQAVN